MKTTQVQFVEFICIFVVSTALAPMAIVYNFIALGIIADFDNYIFESYTDGVKELTAAAQQHLFKRNHTTSKSCLPGELSDVWDEETEAFRPLQIRFRSRSCGQKIAFCIYKLCRWYYSSFYYYF